MWRELLRDWKLEMVVETNVGPKLTDELRGSIPLQATNV